MRPPASTISCACAPASALGTGTGVLPAAVVSARWDWALGLCRTARLTLTAPRRAVLDFLCARAAPIAVEGLVRELVPRTQCHFVSVYRAVKSFEAAGVLRPAVMAGKRAVRLACAGANYLICERCNRAVGVGSIPNLSTFEARLTARTGYQIQYHWLEFSGLCHRCHRLNQVLTA